MAEAPSKQERQACWNARDAYWKCVEDSDNNLVNCKKFRDEYEKNCSKTWVNIRF